MAELAAQGLAIIMVSSEIPEVLGMSDRVIVMREGRIVTKFWRPHDARDTGARCRGSGGGGMTLLKHREALLALAILVSVGLIALRFPAFVAPANLANVFNDTAPLMILVIGQMIVILTKCIDLSVPRTLR